jgi:hypothetical protein
MKENPMQTVEERVAKGMKLLDENVPNWTDKIDLETLELAYCGRCVIGQLFGGYRAGLCQLDLIGGEQDRENGFDITTSANRSTTADEEFAELQAEWTKQISIRKEIPCAH